LQPFNLKFVLILSNSAPSILKWSLSFRVFNLNFLLTSPLTHLCYMPGPFHTS
jgi:hypothetical protein